MDKINIPASKLESFGPKLDYLKCPKPGHNHMDLKFLLQSDLPQIHTLYCSFCLEEMFANQKDKRHEIIPLDQVVQEIVLLSGRYTKRLDPLIEEINKKYRDIAEKDFRNMYEELTVRSDDFKKNLENFQNHIAIFCSNFEHLFQKRLETLFYESLILIDARLSSFKKTFEVLRFKLRSYVTELSSHLRVDQNLEQYCQNLNLVLKDLNAIKNCNLTENMNKLLQEVPLTSQIAEKFEKSCNFDKELLNVINSIVNILNQKLTKIQHELNIAVNKLSKGQQATREAQPNEQKNSKEEKERKPEEAEEQEEQEEEQEEQEEEQEVVEKKVAETPESKKASLKEPLLGNNEEWVYKEKKSKEEEKYEIKEVEEKESGKEDEYEENKGNEENEENEELSYEDVEEIKSPEVLEVEEKNENIIKESGNSSIKGNKNSLGIVEKGKDSKGTRQEESEELRRFAASLVLKAERKAKAQGSNVNGTSKEEDSKNEELDGISMLREVRRQYRSRMSPEQPRLSKKIVKPRRRSKQRDKETEQKLGKYLGIGHRRHTKRERLNVFHTWESPNTERKGEEKEKVVEIKEEATGNNTGTVFDTGSNST